jgi:hypothetical protein
MQRIKPHIAPWFAVVVVGLLLGGGWYLDARGRGQDAAELEARLRRLEQAQLKSVDEAPWGGREPVSRPPAASASPGAGAAFGRPPLPPPLSPQERQRLQRQAVSRLESRFATDGSDPQWATSTEDAVDQAIVDPILAPFHGPQSSSVRCARTMCRLVFSFESMDQAEDWSSFYPLGVARTLPGFRTVSTVLPDGRVELRMYGFRDPRASTAD